MIRPSAQAAAEKCGFVAELAEKFPETNEFIEHGELIDGQAGREMGGGPKATHEDARACVAAARKVLGDGEWTIRIQQKVALVDPDTGETLTEGTPDVQAESPDMLITFDWKKREQWFNGYLAAPEENIQVNTYSVGRCLETGIKRYKNVLVLFGDGEAEAIEGPVVEQDAFWPWIERVRAVQAKDRTPHPGAHCQGCWHRWVCPTYRERAALGVALLPSSPTAIGPLTDEQAGELAARALAVKAAVDVALDLVKAHHKAGGEVRSNGKRYVPTEMPGRKTADVKLLEADGLTKYIRKGADFERWTWRTVKERR